MLYPSNKSIIFYIRSIWVIQRSIEVEGKWDPKKEELEKKIRKSNFFLFYYDFSKNNTQVKD